MKAQVRHLFSLGLLLTMVLGGLAGLATRPAAAAEPETTVKVQRVGVLALATDKFSTKAASLFNRLARENLERDSAYSVIDLRALLAHGAKDPRQKFLAKAGRWFKQGKAQYDELELDLAIDLLTKSVQAYRKSPGYLGAGDGYVQALLFLGAAYILSGDSERGTEQFKQVAVFDPKRVVDRKTFPPSMLAVFNTAKEAVAAAPGGSVLVKSKPSAGEVYLNGVFKGITPLSLAKVPEGTHFIRVERDGYLPWGQRIASYATHEEAVEASLLPTGHLAKFEKIIKNLTDDLDDDPPERALIAFGDWLQAEMVLVIAVSQQDNEVEAEAALIRVRPPERRGYRSAEFNLLRPDLLAQADVFISSLYRKAKVSESIYADEQIPALAMTSVCNSDSDCTLGEVCDSVASRCIPYAPGAKAFYQQWWFWSVIAGSLAVAGGTSYLVWHYSQPEQGSIEFQF